MSVTFDLSEVTETTDVVIDGHTLWVRPGATANGRYWQLLTPSDVRVGMVIERGGALVAVFESPAMDVVRQLVIDLCNCGLGGVA